MNESKQHVHEYNQHGQCLVCGRYAELDELLERIAENEKKWCEHMAEGWIDNCPDCRIAELEAELNALRSADVVPRKHMEKVERRLNKRIAELEAEVLHENDLFITWRAKAEELQAQVNQLESWLRNQGRGRREQT